jgi:hypothetical protein
MILLRRSAKNIFYTSLRFQTQITKTRLNVAKCPEMSQLFDDDWDASVGRLHGGEDDGVRDGRGSLADWGNVRTARVAYLALLLMSR